MEKLQITIDRTFTTDELSSGSGLCVLNDTIYIVGDDAEYIVKSPVNDFSFTRISLYPRAPFTRIPKPVKHDLEASFIGAMNGEQYVFALGSGGISPFRDSLFAVNVNDTTNNLKRSLLSLYTAIKSKSVLKDGELNIEAATLMANELLLFNRGKNFIVTLSWDDFTKYILGNDSTYTPPFEITDISLPEINGYQVGFSGACTLHEKELLFTASLEETTDFIKDGAVKGSYIGIISVGEDKKFRLTAFEPLKKTSGDVLLEKIESIDVVKADDINITAIAVADNDDGTSKILGLSIKRN